MVRNHKIRLVLGLALALTALFAHAAGPAKPTAAETNLSMLPGSSRFNFVAYGDIRFTDPNDTQNSNPKMRDAVVQRIAEVKPAFVVVTELNATSPAATDARSRWRITLILLPPAIC